MLYEVITDEMDDAGWTRLSALIGEAARDEHLPAGGVARCLADRDVMAIARQTGVSPWRVADAALDLV